MITPTLRLAAAFAIATLSAGCAARPPAAPAAAAPGPSSAPPPVAPSHASPVTTTTTSSRADRRVDTMTDLDALARQDAWAELIEHLEDIPPSQRDEAWRTLVIRALREHLRGELKTDTDRISIARTAAGYLRRYPFARAAKELVELRGETGVAAVEACARDGSRWDESAFLVEYFESLSDPQRALLAARAAVKNGHRALGMALFRVASDGDARAACQGTEALALAMDGRGRPAGTTFHKDAEIVLGRCRGVKP